jgi:signal transduction histidine kinase/DNA-binding response OmpR family regulator
MNPLFLILNICFFIVSVSNAQKSTRSRIYNVNDGLSQGMIFDIIQSREGYLWIGTKDGLNRYDGYTFSVFESNQFDPFSIGGGEVRKLFEDSRGWIWINYLNGLDVFDSKSGRFFHLSHPEFPINTGLQSKLSPLRFAEDAEGVVWITDFDRLWRVELTPTDLANSIRSNSAYPKFKISSIDLPELNLQPGKRISAKSVFYSKFHGLLVGTSHGLYQIDTKDYSIKLAALSDTYINIVGEDETGEIWLKKMVGPYAGLDRTLLNEDDDLHGRYCIYVWDGVRIKDTEQCIYYPNLAHLQEGKYFWSLKGTELSQWSVQKLKDKGLPNFTCSLTQLNEANTQFKFLSLITDQSGLVWLATNGYGIIKLNTTPPKFNSFLPKISQRAIVEDHNRNLFTLTNPYTIHPLGNFDKSLPNPLSSLIDVSKLQIPTLFDSSGNAWGNTNSGQIFKIDNELGEFKKFPFRGLGLISNRNGDFVSVDEAGLIHFDPENEKTVDYPFSDFRASGPINLHSHQLYEAKNGVIWIFAFEGLIRAKPTDTGYEYSQFKSNPQNQNSLSINTVLCVADDPIDPSAYLWIGTRGGGLNRLDKKSGVITHYKKKDGLPNNVVYGILPDNQGHIWISTNKGLSRFHVRNETFKNFTVNDGLQDNEFNTGSYLKTSSGNLIFGGINGLTSFYPDSMVFNTRAPVTRIIKYSIGQNDYLFLKDKPLKLPYNKSILSFEFSALDFTDSDQNVYKYLLVKDNLFSKQKEEEWIDLLHNNSIQFANLTPGKYTFKVLGGNSDGFWSEEVEVFEFVITPPWFASIWAYISYSLLIIFVVLGAYRYQFNRKTEQQESIRLKELDAFKNRFFTNLTHEFRTPLTVIMGMVDQIKRNPKKHLDGGIQLIERNSQNLLQLINQLLDLSKLENGSLVPQLQQGDILTYIHYLVESFQSFAEGRKISISFVSGESEIMMDFDPELIKQVMVNLLSNAIKFTPTDGKIQVTVKSSQDKWVSIHVQDTGIGIESEHIPFIFDKFYQVDNKNARSGEGTGIGLAHANELVKIMGGSIEVFSTPNIGTSFIINLPILRNAVKSEVTRSVENNDWLQDTNGSATETLSEVDSKDDNDPPLILLIEDNADIMVYLQSLLQDHYRIIAAIDGEKGIEIALEYIPDLIISDVMMPGKDGFEVCDTLKKDEKTSHIPILLLTAKTDIKSRLTGLNRGADAYLTKPFDSDELLFTLKNIFQSRERIREKIYQLVFQNTAKEIPEEHSRTEIEIEHFAVLEAENDFVQKLKQYIKANMDQTSLSMDELSQYMLMSYQNLYKKLTTVTGLSPVQFIRLVRVTEAEHLLLTTDTPVREIALQVGFSDPKYFSRVFADELGKSPSSVRKNR